MATAGNPRPRAATDGPGLVGRNLPAAALTGQTKPLHSYSNPTYVSS